MTLTDALFPAPTRRSKPDWRKTAATKLGTHEKLIGNTAIPRACPTCGRTCLIGWDAPLCAGLAICDPATLTIQLEAACIILDRPTYRLWGTPGQYQLTEKYYPGLPPTGKPPPTTSNRVLAAHRCGKPLGGTPIPLRPTTTTTVIDGPPPF